jgi:hypothetical protein
MHKIYQFLGTFEDTVERFSVRTWNTAWILQWDRDWLTCNYWLSINYVRVNRHFLLTMLNWKQTMFSLPFLYRGKVYHTLYCSFVSVKAALPFLYFPSHSDIGVKCTTRYFAVLFPLKLLCLFLHMFCTAVVLPIALPFFISYVQQLFCKSRYPEYRILENRSTNNYNLSINRFVVQQQKLQMK